MPNSRCGAGRVCFHPSCFSFQDTSTVLVPMFVKSVTDWLGFKRIGIIIHVYPCNGGCSFRECKLDGLTDTAFECQGLPYSESILH